MTTFEQEWSTYFKSSWSEQGGNCVEVKHTGDTVFIRDSKYLRNPANDPTAQPIIQVPANEWSTFLVAITAGTAVANGAIPAVEHHADGQITLRGSDGIALTYTSSEWDAFLAGVHDREFDRPVAV